MQLDKKKSKLQWHCRRGMLELDLILEKFLKNHMACITEEEIEMFERFLTNTDPDLYAWLMGYESPIDKETIYCVAIILSYHLI